MYAGPAPDQRQNGVPASLQRGCGGAAYAQPAPAPSGGAGMQAQLRTAAAGAAMFSAVMGCRERTGTGHSVESAESQESDEEESVVAEEEPSPWHTNEDEESSLPGADGAQGIFGSYAGAVAAPKPSETEAAVGKGVMAIPTAAASVDQTVFKRKMKPVQPDQAWDLRRFVRPGDVLTYLGGNRWGHCVMALSVPQAFETPTLYSAERLPRGCIPADAFSVRLARDLEQPLDLTLQGDDEDRCLVLGSIQLGGPLDVWNGQHPERRLWAQDRVLEVNGVRGAPEDMLAACEGQQILSLVVWRPTEFAVLAHNVPVFPLRVLQSASNMRDIAESTVCLVVHPFRGTLCSIGPLREGFRVNQGHSGPVEVQILLSPLCRKTMDLSLFRLAVCEVMRAPRDQKWSMRTAVRSYLRNAALKPERFKSQKDKVRLGRKLSETWARRPICSTVPPRVWQKYLLKEAYKKRHDKDRVAGHGTGKGHGATGSFSAEAAFAEQVLRIVPVKDDRVLPADLVAILTDTGAWETLSLEQGPPQRRLQDHEPGEPWCQVPPPCGRRTMLPADVVNRDGSPAHLGADQFTVYCGLQVSRPKKDFSMRVLASDGERSSMAVKDWDGRCGPLDGPQCAACRWLEDRLVQ